MLNICQRHKKPVENPACLLENELYTIWHVPEKPFLIYLSDIAYIKLPSDRKTNTQTYANYYEKLFPNIYFEKDSILGSMKVINRKKIALNKQEESIPPADKTIHYFPVELLYYAPLNQADFELIYKLPSILVRLVQLYHIEQLRKLFAENTQCYPVR